jgi:hypothetical protein
MEKWTPERLAVFAKLQENNLRYSLSIKALLELDLPGGTKEKASREQLEKCDALNAPLIGSLEAWNDFFTLLLPDALHSKTVTKVMTFLEIKKQVIDRQSDSYIYFPACFERHEIFQEWLENELLKLADQQSSQVHKKPA